MKESLGQIKKNVAISIVVLTIIFLTALILWSLFHLFSQVSYSGTYGLFLYDESKSDNRFTCTTLTGVNKKYTESIYKWAKNAQVTPRESGPGWGEGITVSKISNTIFGKNKEEIVIQYSCKNGILYIFDGTRWGEVASKDDEFYLMYLREDGFSYQLPTEYNAEYHIFLQYGIAWMKRYKTDMSQKLIEFRQEFADFLTQHHYSQGPFQERAEKPIENEYDAFELACRELNLTEAEALWYYDALNDLWRVDIMSLQRKDEIVHEEDYDITTVIISGKGEILETYYSWFIDIQYWYLNYTDPMWEEYVNRGIVITNIIE